MTSEVFGWDLAVDCANCDLAKITDADHIKRFVKELVEDIEMVAFGEPIVEKFGEAHLAGYSLVQLIQTSCITAHFADANSSAYFNVFSCKAFDEGKVRDCIIKWFHPQYISMTKLERSVPV
jgi:S-adenosylmethionine/arginine decarboxylase-like enzyme